MVTPEKGEKEKEFLKRCIPQLIREEEYPQKQAVAICYSVYRKKGTEAKSPQPAKKLSKNNKMKLYLTHY